MNLLLVTVKEVLQSTIDKIWDLLTSKQALIAYAIIVLIIVFILVISIMQSEQRRVDEIEHRKKLKQDIVDKAT